MSARVWFDTITTANSVNKLGGSAMKSLTIRRDYYIEKLLGRQMNGFVKVITGIRRCGKSFLLNTLFRQRLREEGVADDHIISVDLDDKAFLALRDPLVLDDYVRRRVRRGKKPY